MIDVYLETGRRKTFAVARAWPGWARSSKTSETALEVLAAYHPRYAAITTSAGIELPPPDFSVVGTIVGGGATDFGVPDRVPAFDREPHEAGDLRRQIEVHRAAHTSFRSVAGSAPEELRKGPRGGGRDTSAIVEHVLEAERRSYAGKIGVKNNTDPIDVVLNQVVERCLQLAEHPEETKWPLPYFLRRATWHVLDHLWEIEDKS